MKSYADTGFLASLYLEENTSERAERAIEQCMEPLPVLPLTELESRNALNLGIVRHRIVESERDSAWQRFRAHAATGVYVEAMLSTTEWYAKARELSDRYTPNFSTRSLDLLHVAAALLLGAEVFYSFDKRQRRVATGEGLLVKP